MNSQHVVDHFLFFSSSPQVYLSEKVMPELEINNLKEFHSNKCL